MEKYKQLHFTLDSLLELLKHRAFSTLIITKHLSDIFAALVQISAAPLMKPVTPPPPEPAAAADNAHTTDDISLKEDKFEMTEGLYKRLSTDQVHFAAQLTRIVEKSYQPMVVKHLLVLHGSAKDKSRQAIGGEQSAPPPKWFSRRVSQLLTARLVSESGVANVIRGVLDMGGGDDSMDWQKVGLIAAVLGNPPEGKYSSIEAYYQQICPQLLDLLNHEDKVYQMIVCASIKTVTERSLILSRRYLLDELMAPFIRLSEPGQGLTVIEAELDECLKSLYKV